MQKNIQAHTRALAQPQSQVQAQSDQLNYLNQAVVVATRAHAGQFRKGSDTPYIVHPYAVAMLARNFTDDPEVIAACLLHDILEDVAPEIYDESKMRSGFGAATTNLVKVVSEPKTNGDVANPWKKRKEAYLSQLVTARDAGDRRALIVSAADKICNLNDILSDLHTIGAQVWHKFAASREEEIWFYRAVFEVVCGDLPTGMAELYQEILEQVTDWKNDEV